MLIGFLLEGCSCCFRFFFFFLMMVDLVYPVKSLFSRLICIYLFFSMNQRPVRM